jgi:hypothetical protein
MCQSLIFLEARIARHPFGAYALLGWELTVVFNQDIAESPHKSGIYAAFFGEAGPNGHTDHPHVVGNTASMWFPAWEEAQQAGDRAEALSEKCPKCKAFLAISTAAPGQPGGIYCPECSPRWEDRVFDQPVQES